MFSLRSTTKTSGVCWDKISLSLPRSSPVIRLLSVRFWEEPPKGGVRLCSVDTKELLVSVMTTVGQVVGAEVAAAPSSWSRALFWLYNKLEELDWTVRFHLKPLWGQHFKNEVPSSLLDVCDLPEQVRTPAAQVPVH